MNFWDEHKKILQIAAVFLGLLFLTWLFYIRSNSGAAYELDTEYEKTIQKDRKILCNPDLGPEISRQIVVYNKANEALKKQFDDMNKQLHYVFPKPLIPPEKVSRPQSYTRSRLKILQDYVMDEIQTKRGIALSENAWKLGFELPLELTEDVEQDRKWVTQMLVIRRFIDTLMPLTEKQNNVAPIVSIEDIAPLKAVEKGGAQKFIREHSLDCSMRITLDGLLKLLTTCDKPDSFFTLQSIDMRADSNERETVIGEKTEDKIINKWHENYYLVHLRVSCLEIYTPDKKAAGAGGDTSKPVYVIPH